MSESRERHRSRAVLVIVQVALALVLLVGSGLMIRTFRALTKVNPGFAAPADVQTFRVSIPETQVKDPARVFRVEEEILHKLEPHPRHLFSSLLHKYPHGWQRQLERSGVCKGPRQPFESASGLPVRARPTGLS